MKNNELKRIINLSASSKTGSAGFTLVELLLVVSLLAISAGVTSDIIITLVRSYNKSQVSNEIEQQANFVGLKIEKELRNATRIVVPSEQYYSQLASAGGNTSLVFKYRDPETTSLSLICYRVNSGVIERSTNTNPDAVSPYCTNAYVPITSNESPGGVNVTCVNSRLAGDVNYCFWNILSSRVDIAKLHLYFYQAGVATNNSISGYVDLNTTVVARGSYN